jgi:hypothetical protein
MRASTSAPTVRDAGSPEVELPEPVVEVELPEEPAVEAEQREAAVPAVEDAVADVELPEPSGVIDETAERSVPVWEVAGAFVLGLIAAWAVVFVPPGLGVVLAALVAIPDAIVAVPRHDSIFAAAVIDRDL